ncbi:MAG: formate dehydrogenase subunit delta [Hyphomicrobiaceae bacterium]
MQPEKLVTMANQIAKFFAAQGHDRALPQVTDHLEKFWDPRMRRQITEHVAKGGAGLEPLALEAIKAMKPASSAA